MAHFRRGDRFLGNAHTPGPPRQAFPAFLADAGHRAAAPSISSISRRRRPPAAVDYSVFSQSAAARGSNISGPVSRSATAFISAFSAKFGLRVILLSAVRVPGSGGRPAPSVPVHGRLPCCPLWPRGTEGVLPCPLGREKTAAKVALRFLLEAQSSPTGSALRCAPRCTRLRADYRNTQT